MRMGKYGTQSTPDLTLLIREWVSAPGGLRWVQALRGTPCLRLPPLTKEALFLWVSCAPSAIRCQGVGSEVVYTDCGKK